MACQLHLDLLVAALMTGDLMNKAPRHVLLTFGLLAALVGFVLSGSPHVYAQTGILFTETFEDTNFGARGWYDSTNGALSAVEHYAGLRSFECRFAVAGTGCVGGTPRRHLFTPSDAVYVGFYIKHSANWVGSGKPYHPHMFQLITNLDPDYVGPAYTYLTAYLEEVGGVPQMGIQDGHNVDETKIGVDLTNVTEARAVAGCNGDSDGYGLGDCYLAGPGEHWNGKMWRLGQKYFDDTPGSPYYKGNWHFVEAYFRLNSIVSGKAAKDGVLRYWYDGALILDKTNVVLRTGAHATAKFNQFLMPPYIGDGSPVDQSFWIDNLTVATVRPGGTLPTPPSAPTNLHVIP